jgi:hypothetical protein
MKVTKHYLIKNNACREGVEWFNIQPNKEHKNLLKALIKDKRADLKWGNWYISRKLPKIKKVMYAVYSSKQVLEIFENEFPKDNRPRLSIKAAEKYIKNPTKNTASASASAAFAASAAAFVTASAAAANAAFAAFAAAFAAANAVSAASAASAFAADVAFDAEKKKLQIKILKYGLKLLEG